MFPILHYLKYRLLERRSFFLKEHYPQQFHLNVQENYTEPVRCNTKRTRRIRFVYKRDTGVHFRANKFLLLRIMATYKGSTYIERAK